MKYFVYAKIGNYLYLQRNLPDFLSCRLNFVSFYQLSRKICKNRVKFRILFLLYKL